MKFDRIVAVLALALLGACASFEATGPGGDSALEFRAWPANHGQWLEQPVVTAEPRGGGIVVTGRLSAPNPCQTVSGQLERAGSGLTLRVSIRPSTAEVCVGMIGTFEYEATVSPLAPGEYRLRVIHEYPQTGWPTTTALDQQFQLR